MYSLVQTSRIPSRRICWILCNAYFRRNPFSLATIRTSRLHKGCSHARSYRFIFLARDDFSTCWLRLGSLLLSNFSAMPAFCRSLHLGVQAWSISGGKNRKKLNAKKPITWYESYSYFSSKPSFRLTFSSLSSSLSSLIMSSTGSGKQYSSRSGLSCASQVILTFYRNFPTYSDRNSSTLLRYLGASLSQTASIYNWSKNFFDLCNYLAFSCYSAYCIWGTTFFIHKVFFNFL